MVTYWKFKNGVRVDNVRFLVELDSLAHARYEKERGVRIMKASTQKKIYWYQILSDGQRIDTAPSEHILNDYEIDEALKGFTQDMGIKSIKGFSMELVK